MKPILFPSYETAFTSQGLGALSDAISCVVREERNGEYELTMEYPVGGVHYDEIEGRCLILAKPSPYRDAQPFRIYSIETNIEGLATIHAHHLSYDLSGIAVSPFTAGSCSSALSGLLSHSVVDNPFSCWTDKSVDGQYKLVTPNSFRACLGGEENSILDVYGKGEYEFDTFDVKLHTNRGNDNGVVIAYGKNLTDFNMERNLESVTTAVYPFWQDVESGEIVELDDKIIQLYDPSVPIYLKESGGDFLAEVTNKLLVVHGVFDFDNVMVLDLSTEFEKKPSQFELFNRARKYIIDNQIARPRISIDVSFVDLASTEEYKNSPIEQVDLCDIVTVRFPLIGIEVKAEIVSIETDVLLDRYNSVQIGDARTTLDMTLAQAMLSPTKEELKVGMASAADYINNTHGTFEWIDNGDDTNGGFTIYENGSQSWLRCTAGGLGISANGGITYTNAITKNGVLASELHIKRNGVEVLSADEGSNGLPRFVLRDVDGSNLLWIAPFYIDNNPQYEEGMMFNLYNADGTRLLYIGTFGDSNTGKITGAAMYLGNGHSLGSSWSSSALAFYSGTGTTAFRVTHPNQTNIFYLYGYYDSNSNAQAYMRIYNPQTGNRSFEVISDNAISRIKVMNTTDDTEGVRLSSYTSGGKKYADISVHPSGSGNASFEVLSIDGKASIDLYDTNGSRHRAVWQTITINGTTYYLLGATS